MLPLTTLPLERLTEILGSRARAVAVMQWLFQSQPVPRALPETLSTVSQKAWDVLRAQVHLPVFNIRERAQDSDGTTKFLLDLNGSQVETVLIPARGRSTVCVSSQVGCTRRCAFCATATLGFRRQLTADEIVTEFLVAREQAPASSPVRNVVFMGMGEPMDNLDAVLRAVEVLTQSPAPQLALEHVTVSTSGVLPGMLRFLRESRASLALSLNGTTDEQRLALMPHTKTWSIDALLGALREDNIKNPRRTHFIEYVVLEGVNDSDEDAARLGVLLKGIRARVNLIPHNAFTGNSLRSPSDERIAELQKKVRANGVRCLVRWNRGRNIAAACGQLAFASRPAEEIAAHG